MAPPTTATKSKVTTTKSIPSKPTTTATKKSTTTPTVSDTTVSSKKKSTSSTTTTTTTAPATTTTTKQTTKSNTKKSIEKVSVEIKEIRENDIVVNLKQNNKNYIGRIHFTNLDFNSTTTNIKSPIKLNELYKISQKIDAYILSIDEEISFCQLSICKPEESAPTKVSDLKLGQSVNAIVYGRTSSTDLSVWIGPNLLASIDIVSNFKSIKSFNQSKQLNTLLKCEIKSIENEKVEVVIKDYKSETLKANSNVLGTVLEINNTTMKVRLQNNLVGVVKMIDVSEQFGTSPFSEYRVGDLLTCHVRVINKDGIFLSLYQSMIGTEEHKCNPRFNGKFGKHRIVTQPKEGATVWGYIVEENENIVRVELATNLMGVMLVNEIPKYQRHLVELGKLVYVRIKSEPKQEGSFMHVVKVSLAENGNEKSYKNIKVGDIIPLEVLAVKEHGLILHHAKFNGFCHVSQLGDDNRRQKLSVQDIEKLYPVGDLVIGKCINVQHRVQESNSGSAHEKTIIDFSLKSEHFTQESIEKAITPSWDIQDTKGDEFKRESIKQLPKDNLISSNVKSTTVNQEDEEFKEPSIEKEDQVIGFQWNDIEFTDNNNNNNNNSKKRKEIEKYEDEIGEDEIIDKKKIKSEKQKSKKQIEEETKEREDLLADHNKAPESPQDYERLLLGSPNSSYIWVQYMSFYLSLSEISKSREIGERALKKIIPTEVLELRNIWVALYNLENMYGTPESLLKLFQRSILYQDPKTMYLIIIPILETSNKFNLVEDYFKMAFKKYKHSSKIWCKYGEFLLKAGKHEMFTQIISKSLDFLAKKKQVKVISKYGQLEYKMGEAERGRNIFEGIVSNYPNRTDLWNIYLDMEMKSKNQEQIRKLFTRCINLKTSDRNIKQFFKKYLQYEKENGDRKSVEKVKELAMKFVDSQ
eukprot:gene3195-4001_t